MTPTPWRSRAGGGAVHSINCGQGLQASREKCSHVDVYRVRDPMNLCEICRTHSEQFHILRPPPRLGWVWNLPDAELLRRNTFRLSGSKTNTFLLEIPELKTDRSYSKGGFLWIILLRIPHTLLMPFP
jgi:hypothetical protein